jgi:nitrite reductase/ring-hydroxylating ferredoxin subunit
MPHSEDWIDIGAADELGAQALQPIEVQSVKIALSCAARTFGAVHNACNHVGGPLGEGALDGDYIVCPWHQWKFHRVTGLGEPGFEEDRVPSFPVKVENGRVLLQLRPTKRQKAPHEPHPLARPVLRAEGPIRVAGISTTAMDKGGAALFGLR